LTQRVLLIQGPPGTGKTQVADAIFRVWGSTGAEGPAVGASPSNVAADNLASRLVRTARLVVRRYGDPDKITDPEVKEISSQAMAFELWTGANQNAKRNRKNWQSEQFATEIGVVIGTLELAGEIQTQKRPWTSQVIVVDEAGQTTEPMTLIPLQLAATDAHLILIGDHRQLPPTVVSEGAAWDGLGTSMFERLIRSPGIDSCMLTIQYRMHESICSWPSHEFYEGRWLLTRH